ESRGGPLGRSTLRRRRGTRGSGPSGRRESFPRRPRSDESTSCRAPSSLTSCPADASPSHPSGLGSLTVAKNTLSRVPINATVEGSRGVRGDRGGERRTYSYPPRLLFRDAYLGLVHLGMGTSHAAHRSQTPDRQGSGHRAPRTTRRPPAGERVGRV